MAEYLGIWVPHKIEEEINPFQPLRGCICEANFSEEEDPQKVIGSIYIENVNRLEKKIEFKITINQLDLFENLEIMLTLADFRRALFLFKIERILPINAKSSLYSDFWEKTLTHFLKSFYHNHYIHSEEELLSGVLLDTTNNWIEKLFYKSLENFQNLFKTLLIEYQFGNKLIEEFSKQPKLKKEPELKRDLVNHLHDLMKQLEVLYYVKGFLSDVDLLQVKEFFIKNPSNLSSFFKGFKTLEEFKEKVEKFYKLLSNLL